ITYFDGFTRVADPGRANITTAQNLQAANTQFAIADPQGRVVMTNPGIGRIGTMGQKWIEGPGQISVDAKLAKRGRVGESKEIAIWVDAINVLNHPNFGNPTMDVNNANFGVIALPTSGNRTFTFNARVTF